MENPGYKNEENKWVEERIARLSPPLGWRPDADRALERVMQGKPASASRGLRVSLAAVTLAAIAVVLTLLPWHMLWTPSAPENPAAAQQPGLLAQTKPETAEPPTVTRAVVPNVAPVQEEMKENPTVAPGSVQQTPVEPGTPQPRQKKFPRTIASAGEKEGASIMQVAAQGQGQPTPLPSSPPSSGVSEPVLVSMVHAAYTPEAREARIQGTVEILVVVREDGTVKADRVRKSLGYGLDEAAVAAVEQFKFIPGKKDGKPVPVYVSLLVHFALK